MEVRKIEGWRNRQQRELEELKVKAWDSGRLVQILEEGQRVRYNDGREVFIGRRLRISLSGGVHWERLRAISKTRKREYLRDWWDRVKREKPERWNAQLGYIRDWQQRFKQERPEQWKEMRQAIEARSREKRRDQINDRQREARAAMSPEKKAEVRFVAAIYAQLVKLAGLR